MKIEGHTIILSSPQELIPIIMEAIRMAGIQTYPDRESYDPPNKKLLSPKDVEREYGIHKNMLHSWRTAGVGPSYTTFGRRILYERQVIENFISSGRIKTDPLLS